MKNFRLLAFIFSAIFFISGACYRNPSHNKEDLIFTILQINDVYEIEPLSGGEEGGMARVAAIRKQLLSQDPNTISVLAGDFLNPSFMGTLTYQGQPLAGRQMVETMNAAGIDYVTFGNHEFDIRKKDLQQRINESAFTWVSANVKELTSTGTEEQFIKKYNGNSETIKPFTIHHFNYKNGKEVKLGIIGVTIPSNKADSIRYEDIFSSFGKSYNSIKDSCDVIIGLTHLEMGMDKKLARDFPELDLIIGGHEHVAMNEKVGNVTICKADANARTAYIHKFSYDQGNGKLKISSELKKINTSILADSGVSMVVEKWVTFQNNALSNLGFRANEKLMNAEIPLEGREFFIRTQPTNFTDLIAKAMLYSIPAADASVFNSGGIRIDDQLKGEITQADILRSLPFGGSISIVSLTGEDLIKILNAGTAVSQKGNGGFLQYAGVTKNDNKWTIKNQEIISGKFYTLVLPTFLTKGREKNLEFIATLNNTTPEELLNNGIENNYKKNDIRNAVIAYIKSGMKNPLWVNR